MEFINIRQLIKQNGLDALLVTKPADVFYLSSFRSSNCALVFTEHKSILLTDSRYTLIAQSVAGSFEIMECNTGLVPFVKNLFSELQCKKVGIQDGYMALSEYLEYSRSSQIEYCPVGERLTVIRSVKTGSELENIIAAQKITDQAFKHMLGFIRLGQTEKEIALELEYTMKKHGAEQLSFDSIVASGPNSAKPHAVPEDRTIRGGDMLTLDFGCVVNGYCSDMTRTVAIGRPCDELIKIYTVVLEAHNRAKQALRPGAAAKDIDSIARGYIEQNGYGRYFGHGLGHGVGVEIHELPVLSYRSDEVLKQGNVVTVEPGIYVPGLGGVRIENMCFITEDGYMDITKSDKKLIIL